MRSADQIYVVLHSELAHDVLSESEGNTAIVVAKLFDPALRIGPEQVAEETGVWHVRWPDYILDLVQVFQLGRETSVHTEDLLVDNRRHWQTVKNVRECFPEFDGITTLAFIIETIDAINLSALVIAPQ